MRPLADPNTIRAVRRVELRLGTEPSMDRVRRTSLETVQSVGSAILGAAYIVFLVVNTGAFTHFDGLAAPWWLPLSIAVVIASGCALIGVAVMRRPERLGAVAGVCALAYLGAIIAWFPAWSSVSLVDRDPSGTTLTVWLTLIPELASVALMLAGRPMMAVLNLGVAGVLTEAVTAQMRSGELDAAYVAQTLWSLAWAGLYLVLAGTAVAFARRLDADRSATIDSGRDRVREDIIDVDRRRLDALVHDRIIAFLLALRPGQPQPATVEAASGVLHELDHWWDDPVDASDGLDAAEFVRRIDTLITSLGSAVAIRTDVDCSPAMRFSEEATGPLIDACAEAVRNFYRHAGAEASCVVTAVLRDDRIAVSIVDDGAGFDPGDTGPGRLGLSFGVTGRMAAIPGGSSSISSLPGEGTRIRLQWDRP
ncbi:hypothetical protein [Gordonia zhaorongruii]|uniref:hypothetical protein n=1 Tax=Gordonia zhaorongruii TaxID=2597659 RepID=UPI0010517F3C|nr:hypothetical protein [Gordonia zhaorongruii]